jgi:hypothetical protein
VPKIIVAALLLALSPLSYAGCEHPTEGVVKALNDYPGGKTSDGRTFVDCKVWPADPTKTLVALVNPQNVPDSEAFQRHHYDLEILVLETSSGVVLQSLFRKDALITDTMQLLNIGLDTARYVLAPGVIAFGVRAYRRAPFDDEMEDLNLYVIQENKLKPILDNLMMHELYTGRDSDTGEHDCSSTDSSRTLAIAKTNTHGYADLMVQEKKSVRDVGSKDDCSDAKTFTSSRRYVLHFDGSSYVLPDELHDG